SSTTTILPAAYCDAYLFGRAWLKSYSGSISSASTRPASPTFLCSFFILSPLTGCRRPGADKANCFPALGCSPADRSLNSDASQGELGLRSWRDRQSPPEYLRGRGIRRPVEAGLLAPNTNLDSSRRRKLARRQCEFHDLLFTGPECDSLEPRERAVGRH